MMGEIVRHLKVSDDSENDCLTGEKEVSEPDKEVSEELFEVSEVYQTPTEEGFFDRKWRCKAVSKRKNGIHTTPVLLFLNAFAGGIAVVTTYTNQIIDVQIIMYLFALGFFILSDPPGCFETILADRSRFILAAGILINCISIAINMEIVWIACTIMDLFIIAIIYICNKDWLLREFWLMTEFVERAMEKDPDNIAIDSWKAHGKRETRTLLHEIGLSVPEHMLDNALKSIYMLGHMHASENVGAKERQIKKLQEDFLNAKIDLETMADYKSRCKSLEMELENVETQIAIRDRNIEKLKADLEELQKSTEQIDKSELIEKLLNAGLSIRVTAEIAGVTRHQVEKMKAKIKEE